MRQGVGVTFTFNIVIIFLTIMFGLLAATISYYKAFKVNNRILSSIEKFEGYNSLAQDEINDTLTTLGYTVDSTGQEKCAETKNGGTLVKGNNVNHFYCVYFYRDDTGKTEIETNNDNQPFYYNYAVVTYIYVNLPIIDSFKIPVYTKGERTFNFAEGDELPTSE